MFIFFVQNFLEDYGMIWVGNNSSSDNDEDDKEENILENEIEEAPLWEPGIFSPPRVFWGLSDQSIIFLIFKYSSFY